MRVVIGHSDDIDTADAIRIVITQCQKKLRGDCPKAGIFLTSIRETDYTPLLEAVLNAFPGIILVGCTTDGEVTSLYDFLDDSVALLLFCGDELRFGAGIGPNLSQNCSQAALTAYNQARQALGSAGRLCLAFPDGLSCIDLPINTLLQNIFATGFPVFGGTAGDQFVFNKTYQFFGREVYSDALPLLLIDGEFHYSWGNLSGWLPIGQRYEIVSTSNVVWRIGDKTALDFYRHFLGGKHHSIYAIPSSRV